MSIAAPSNETIVNLSNESRRYPPSAEFAAQANVDGSLWATAAEDTVEFWAEQARRLDRMREPLPFTRKW